MSKSRKKSAASLAAAALVRRRNRLMSPKERSEAARHAVNARWARYREAQAAEQDTVTVEQKA